MVNGDWDREMKSRDRDFVPRTHFGYMLPFTIIGQHNTGIDLPNYIRESRSIIVFKNKFKEYLINLQKDKTKDKCVLGWSS
jgi:hypothetical protein